jgi:hypothetical protein
LAEPAPSHRRRIPNSNAELPRACAALRYGARLSGSPTHGLCWTALARGANKAELNRTKALVMIALYAAILVGYGVYNGLQLHHRDGPHTPPPI